MSNWRHATDGKPRRAFHEVGIRTMDRGLKNLAHLGFINAACSGCDDQNWATFGVGEDQ